MLKINYSKLNRFPKFLVHLINLLKPIELFNLMLKAKIIFFFFTTITNLIVYLSKIFYLYT